MFGIKENYSLYDLTQDLIKSLFVSSAPREIMRELKVVSFDQAGYIFFIPLISTPSY